MQISINRSAENEKLRYLVFESSCTWHGVSLSRRGAQPPAMTRKKKKERKKQVKLKPQSCFRKSSASGDSLVIYTISLRTIHATRMGERSECECTSPIAELQLNEYQSLHDSQLGTRCREQRGKNEKWRWGKAERISHYLTIQVSWSLLPITQLHISHGFLPFSG